MDWADFTGRLRIGTIAALDALLPTLAGQRLYALCLQTDDGAMSVGPCANTEEGLAERLASEAEENRPADASYFRWAPAEWRYEMFGDEHLEAVGRELYDAVMEESEAFNDHFASLIDAMIEALRGVRAARAAPLAGVTLFATISDSGEAPEVERRSAALLNLQDMATAFERQVG